MTPFYGWGSAAPKLEPLREGSWLFTTKLPEIPGTHFNEIFLGDSEIILKKEGVKFFWGLLTFEDTLTQDQNGFKR